MMGSSCSSHSRQSDSSHHASGGEPTMRPSGIMSSSPSASQRRPLRHSVSSAVPDESISRLYPEEENYIITQPGLRSPKSLSELATESVCRHLPQFAKELPSGLPQDVVDTIVQSLLSHSALNASTLRALKHCELRQLALSNCRFVTDDWLQPLTSGTRPVAVEDTMMLSSPSHVTYEAFRMTQADSSMDVEASKHKHQPETFYGAHEDALSASFHGSDASFVSAQEDHHPMHEEDAIADMEDASCCWEANLAAHLTVLDLRGSQHLTDRGLLQLTGLNRLEEARLDNCHSLVGRGLLACSASHHLRILSLTNCRRLTDDAVIHISHLLSLEKLLLGGCRCLTDRSLTAIADLVNLRNLDLSRCDLITDKGLTSLETLTSLEELSLGWCRQITDAGIECLVRQPYRELHLRVLSLARCPITGDSMNQLGRLWSLEHLDVNGCTGIVGATFADGLKQLGRLISLDASYCPNILRFPLQGTINNVKVLDLRYSNVTNSQLFKFTSLPALEELNLDSCSVGDVAIAHLADKNVCPNLVSLDLADNNLTDVGMEKIAKLRKLIRLSLFYCNITNVGLRHLSQLQDLEVLNLDSREITDEGLLPLKNLKKLKSLDIFSGRITDAGCRHISGMELLESLELCGGAVGDFGCTQLARLEKLMSLNLSQNDRITNRGAAALGALLNLRSLNLSNTSVDSGALRLLHRLVKLQSLSLYGCRGMDTSQSVVKLQDKLPNLKCLRLDTAAEHDGTYVADHDMDDSNSTWSGSESDLMPAGDEEEEEDDEMYSDYD